MCVTNIILHVHVLVTEHNLIIVHTICELWPNTCEPFVHVFMYIHYNILTCHTMLNDEAEFHYTCILKKHYYIS